MNQDQEWEAIYRDLSRLLSSFGKDDAFGAGDFWIVDDNWGNPVHKVHVSNPSIITAELVESVGRAISQYQTRWEVRLVVDAPEALGPHPQMGIRIFANALISEVPEELAQRIPFLCKRGSPIRPPRNRLMRGQGPRGD